MGMKRRKKEEATKGERTKDGEEKKGTRRAFLRSFYKRDGNEKARDDYVQTLVGIPATLISRSFLSAPLWVAPCPAFSCLSLSC